MKFSPDSMEDVLLTSGFLILGIQSPVVVHYFLEEVLGGFSQIIQKRKGKIGER